MDTSNNELLKILEEIRDLLIPISACFEDEYLDIQRQKKRLEDLKPMLTSIRRSIFPLLFDPRRLSQVAIAEEVTTSPSNVSRFTKTLLEKDFVEQIKDENGNTVYQDKYNLVKWLQNAEEK